MATKYLSFRGKSHFCKPYDAQIDRAFEDKEEGHYANWNTGLNLSDDTLLVYRALALSQVKIKEGNLVTFKRPEFKKDFKTGELIKLGAPQVTLPENVEPGAFIGNGSDITVNLEVYDYSHKGRPGRAARWAGVIVNELVEYQKPEPAATGPAVPF